VTPHVLVVRLDSAGDVLLTGPAVRAVAAGARRMTYLCGPRGRAAAGLLPGVDHIVVHRAPWIDPEPEPVSAALTAALIEDLAGRAIDQAIILTSFHQSAPADRAPPPPGRDPGRGRSERGLPRFAARRPP